MALTFVFAVAVSPFTFGQTAIDSLRDRADEQFSAGHYEQAINTLQQALSQAESTAGKESVLYADILGDLSGCYYGIGNYQEALRLGKDALEKKRKMLGAEHDDVVEMLSNLCVMESELGNYTEAMQLITDAMQIRKDKSAKQTYSDAILLNNLANLHATLGNLPEAVRLATESLQILKKSKGKKSSEYATALLNLAGYQTDMGHLSEASRLYIQAMKIAEKTIGRNHPDFITYLSNYADFCTAIGKLEEAELLLEEALQICKTTIGTDHPDYIHLLHTLAVLFSRQDNIPEAIRNEEEVMAFIEINYGTNNSYYIASVSSLSDYYLGIGDYESALKYAKETVRISEQTFGKEGRDYAISLGNLAKLNTLSDNYSEAISLTSEALRIMRIVGNDNDSDYARLLNSLAGYYLSTEKYDEALKLQLEALNLYETSLGKESIDYAHGLNVLASIYVSIGDYTQALYYATEAKVITEKIVGKEHSLYATNLLQLANIYEFQGNYPKAIRLANESLKIFETRKGDGSFDYTSALQQLADVYGNLGDHAKAIQLETKSLHAIDSIFGNQSLYYAASLKSLAGHYCMQSNYDEALSLTRQALSIYRNTDLNKSPQAHSESIETIRDFCMYYAYAYPDYNTYSEALQILSGQLPEIERIYGKENPIYGSWLAGIARLNRGMGNFSEATRLWTDVASITEKSLGVNHMHYIIATGALADLSFLQNNTQDLENYSSQHFKKLYNQIRNTFTNLSERERSVFWAQFQNNFLHTYHKYASSFPTSTLISNGYNAALLSKGLMLHLSRSMSELLHESGDAEALALYQDLKAQRYLLQREYDKPIAERTVNTDSLETTVNNMEQMLIQKSKVYGDYTRDMGITWKDVQKKLTGDDVCIEFVSFPINNDSITRYVAYVLQKGMKNPEMVKLFDENQLPDRGTIFNSSRMNAARSLKAFAKTSELVWKPLAQYINGKKNIYFSPSGQLHNLPIEALPHWEDSCMMTDRWHVYRLSSTRQIALNKECGKITDAEVYGGISYDTDIHHLADNNPQNASSLNFKYLESSKVEAEWVKQTLQDNGIGATLQEDTLATEETFKALSGKRKSLLHIATHGFYWTEQEAQQRADLNFLSLGDMGMNVTDVEDKALTRSGLVFAGANRLQGRELPEDVDDGILTAQEVSRLDLRGLDLLVLSACQAGLGEVTGEGVFGLQRGFKMAGANALMMTLWWVDDNATQLLMTQFYQNMLAGKDKYEALHEAQRYVREYDKADYKMPYYWAGFVLLDAM